MACSIKFDEIKVGVCCQVSLLLEGETCLTFNLKNVVLRKASECRIAIDSMSGNTLAYLSEASLLAMGFADAAAFYAWYDEQLAACCEAANPTDPMELPPVKGLPEVWYEKTDIKQENPICVCPWMDGNTGSFLGYYEDTDTDLVTILNKKDYNMSNHVGTPISQNLAANTEDVCRGICLKVGQTLTDVDVLALLVADGALLPDGTTPTGFIMESVMVKYPGQLGKDDDGNLKTLKPGFIVELNGDPLSPGTTLCEKEDDLTDNDCDTFVKGDPFTFENTGTTDAYIRPCGLVVPLDADDQDVNVQ